MAVQKGQLYRITYDATDVLMRVAQVYPDGRVVLLEANVPPGQSFTRCLATSSESLQVAMQVKPAHEVELAYDDNIPTEIDLVVPAGDKPDTEKN